MKIDFEEVKKSCLIVFKKTLKEELEKMKKEGYKYVIYDPSNLSYRECIYDICGIAKIKFKNRRNTFYRQYVKYLGEKDITSFYDYPSSGRQELRINKAIAEAIAEMLNTKYNAEVYAYSWVD